MSPNVTKFPVSAGFVSGVGAERSEPGMRSSDMGCSGFWVVERRGKSAVPLYIGPAGESFGRVFEKSVNFFKKYFSPVPKMALAARQ